LGIDRYRLHCIIGILPEERTKMQDLLITVKMKVNLSKCLLSGKIEDSVDYTQIAIFCKQLANQNEYLLIETFAADIIDRCMTDFHILGIYVKIEKPSAIPNAACAFIELERNRCGC
jgi:dihydroneopterin aldolase